MRPSVLGYKIFFVLINGLLNPNCTTLRRVVILSEFLKAMDTWENDNNDINSGVSQLNVNAPVFVPGQNVFAAEFVPGKTLTIIYSFPIDTHP